MKMKKAVAILTLMTLLITGTTACSAGGGKPDYLIRASRDNGFVPAYRAYFAIKDDKLTKISSYRFEKLLYGNSDYSMIPEEYYSFDVYAETGEPSEWEYEQNKYNDVQYDEEILIGQLEEMGVSYTGNIYILVTEFDDYAVIEVTDLEDDSSTIVSSSYGLFKDGRMLDLPDKIDLSSVNDFYRLAK